MGKDVYFNLIHDKWLPVRRRSGKRERIRPAQIVDQSESDPVVSFEWSRPDFQVACYEFMIGLLATAFPPATVDEWKKLWRTPPTVGKLDETFSRLDEAFYLNRPEKRFLQDFSELESSIELVERLLIDAPGDSTVKKNTDLFIHRGRIRAMSLPDAAMALYTLQSWAPSGGAGNMTGIRGGGPMVTLVLPRRPDPQDSEKTLPPTLWDTLWANTPCGKVVTEQDMPKVFPWMAPTIISGKKGRKIDPKDKAVDLRQCWWGMPRRIRLCFGTDEKGEILVTGWKQRPYGPDYTGWIGEPLDVKSGVVVHPLTPRYRAKATSEWLSLHPQPGGVHYKHWAGIVAEVENRLPASNVANWRNKRASCTGLNNEQSKNVRLLTAGYDMDNMKVRNFLESEMPLPGDGEPELQRLRDEWARHAIEGAAMVQSVLKQVIKNAMPNKRDASYDTTFYTTIDQKFTERTENKFFELILKKEDGVILSREWLKSIRGAALDIFSEITSLTSGTKLTKAGKIVAAKRRLRAVLGSENLAKILGLPFEIIRERKIKNAR
ncbi:type I-E CRISPR-associated protein Cse1/CasA [Acetobacteraceae bacterium ESL0709]|nr:type I-E CRISPR-associated protein Cse1/CasA [Acetobacteraceae bacterium ESL0697]MDF7677511.1 type I-E CRISPR-associated protein Cse1/CasA [Acetobacteraceae bacterium ESL0709]